MEHVETVSTGLVDIYAKQCEDVSKMRTSLLMFNENDPISTKRAMQNITVLRVYHQMARIIRFTEMLDKIEDKMYSAIDNTLDDMDEYDEGTWIKLVSLQERLQRSMIESHKLLEPYLDFTQLSVIESNPVQDSPNAFASMMLNQESREKLRSSAQQVIAELEKNNPGVVKDDK